MATQRLDRGKQRLGACGLGPHRTICAREIEQCGGLVGHRGTLAQALLDTQRERGITRGRLDRHGRGLPGRHRVHAGRKQGKRSQGRESYKTFTQPGLALD